MYDYMMHIAYVEDNEILAKSVVKVLKHHGYGVTYFTNGEDAKKWLKTNFHLVDMIVLDLLLPGLDGLGVAQALREAKIHTPILMLTAKNSTSDVLEGFDYGADDYLKKPFSFDELLVRIRAILRRPKEIIPNTIKLPGGIDVDFKSQIVKNNGKKVHLTTKEFAILSHFVSFPNMLHSKEVIYEKVFDFVDTEKSNTVEVHIKNIRSKLKNKNHEIPLKTIRGRGYRLDL
jgi:DNA-binding response OmpR family regulator